MYLAAWVPESILISASCSLRQFTEGHCSRWGLKAKSPNPPMRSPLQQFRKQKKVAELCTRIIMIIYYQTDRLNSTGTLKYWRVSDSKVLDRNFSVWNASMFQCACVVYSVQSAVTFLWFLSPVALQHTRQFGTGKGCIRSKLSSAACTCAENKLTEENSD